MKLTQQDYGDQCRFIIRHLFDHYNFTKASINRATNISIPTLRRIDNANSGSTWSTTKTLRRLLTRVKEQQKIDKGLYDKFTVIRNDGDEGAGSNHPNPKYLVIDMVSDEFADDVVRLYAERCQYKYPRLAQDLLNILENPDSC